MCEVSQFTKIKRDGCGIYYPQCCGAISVTGNKYGNNLVDLQNYTSDIFTFLID